MCGAQTDPKKKKKKKEVSGRGEGERGAKTMQTERWEGGRGRRGGHVMLHPSAQRMEYLKKKASISAGWGGGVHAAIDQTC